MRKRFKKINALILAGLLSVLCVSCSGKKNNKSEISGGNSGSENSVSIVNSDNTAIFKKSELKQPEDIGGITGIIYNEENDNILIFGNNGICITDSTFGVYRTLKINAEGSVSAVSGNKIFMISSAAASESADDAGYSHKITVYDFNGSKLSGADITGAELNAITDMACIDGDRLLISDGEKCVSVDTKGNVLGELKADGVISCIVRFSDGRLACTVSYKSKAEVRCIDPDSMQFDDYKAVLPGGLGGYMITGSGGYLAYIRDDSVVYGLKEDNTAYKVIDLTESGLSGLNYITPISDGDFLAVENGKIIRLSEKDASEVSGITEINLAVAGKYDSIERNISDFNAQSNNYRIKVTDYSANYDYNIEGLDSAVKDLEMDIISGKIPDMVWIEPNEAAKLASKGAFADLYDFMETDKTYPREAFLPNYLEACETDGHLFTIAPAFMIKTMAAKTAHVDKPNWTIDEFIEIYNSKPDDMELFEQANNEEAVLGFISNSGTSFIDYEDFTCSFDSDEYIRMLEFAARFPGVDDYDFEQRSCRDDTALLSDMYISSFRDINAQMQGTFGEDITFVGMPTENGNGSVILLSYQFAIMEKSTNKKGAWEFIRTLLNAGSYNGIPVTVSAFETVREEALEKPFFIDENGNKEYMSETIHDWAADRDVTIVPMTESQADYYADFVTGITVALPFSGETAVSNIIREETAAFFAGEVSAEDCAAMIQNRVSIYLSEQE